MSKKKKCKPNKEVSKAGGILSNKNSTKKEKSNASNILNKHKKNNH